MKSLNRIVLLGNLAADVDFRQTTTGRPVANFPLAINRMSRDKDGNRMSVADFHRIVSWGPMAEICDKHLAKGAAICVEGKLINRSFDDKEGKRQFRTEVVADDISILTWKKTKSGDKGVELESIKNENVEEEEVPA